MPRKIIIIFVVLLLTTSGSAVYFYRQLADLKQNPQKVEQEELSALVASVSKLIVLPEGEEPTVATVTDVDKLREEAFFAKSKNGDKVLIYAKAKKAILYDPVTNKVIDIAPLNISDEAVKEETPAP